MDAPTKKSKSWRSYLQSPASKRYTKAIAATYDEAMKDQKPEDGLTCTYDLALTDKEKAKAMTSKRHADAPSGGFFRGPYRGIDVSPGTASYQAAKGAIVQ